jgi:hypothetical protein
LSNKVLCRFADFSKRNVLIVWHIELHGEAKDNAQMAMHCRVPSDFLRQAPQEVFSKQGFIDAPDAI